MFEAASRDHARRLVATGEPPPDTLVGRWWRDETAEIDVLGLAGDGPVLTGECRWQARPVTERDLAELRRRSVHLPPSPAGGTRYAFWSRGGASGALTRHPDVRAFTAADVLE